MRRNGFFGFIRRGFARDRLTGQLAVGLVGVLAVAAVVFGVGVASARYELSDVGAWLSANRKGLVVHANGLVGRVDGKTKLIAGMRGHEIKIVQDGTNVLIVDQQTGVVSRIDPSQLKVEQSRSFDAVGLQVVVGAGRAYTVAPATGAVQEIDPLSLAAKGQPAALTPPLGPAGLDATGTLWVPSPATGQVVPFRDGRPLAPVPVGKPGDRLALTIAAGTPVFVNSTAATATVAKTDGGHLKVALPPAVSRSGVAGALVPPRTEGPVVPLLVKESGSLVVLHTGTGAASVVRLKMPAHSLGAPQILGAKVYIPDDTAGALIVYNTDTNELERPIPVTGKPSKLEVFVKDGLLWANDPNGERAVVLDSGGVLKEVRKYEDSVPGGEKRRRIPTPAAPTNSGDKPEGGGDGPGGNSSPPTVPPTNPPVAPDQPPTKPDPVKATPGAGVIDVEFPGSASKLVTGYVLKNLPSGFKASPPQIRPTGPYTFRVEGGSCDKTYRFRVAVLYQENGQQKEVVSDPTLGVSPCVTPGAPRNVQSTAETQGAKVTWTAPDNDGGGDLTYRVSWTGAKPGSKDAGSGMAITLPEVYQNGQYTFTVEASNAADSGQTASTSAQLTGPTQRYAIQHNGTSWAYMNAAPDTGSADVHRVFDNGHTFTVHCQKKGAHFAHPNGKPGFAGDLYDLVEISGKRGYMIGYLVNTPKDPWQEYAGPPLWICA